MHGPDSLNKSEHTDTQTKPDNEPQTSQPEPPNYEEYENNWTGKTKSERRESSRKHRETDSRMRGNRYVFEVQKSILKRGREAKSHKP